MDNNVEIRKPASIFHSKIRGNPRPKYRLWIQIQTRRESVSLEEEADRFVEKVIEWLTVPAPWWLRMPSPGFVNFSAASRTFILDSREPSATRFLFAANGLWGRSTAGRRGEHRRLSPWSEGRELLQETAACTTMTRWSANARGADYTTSRRITVSNLVASLNRVISSCNRPAFGEQVLAFVHFRSSLHWVERKACPWLSQVNSTTFDFTNLLQN